MRGLLPSAADADTFDRSCAHWSANGRAGMESFYAHATVDYRYLADSIDWAALLVSLSAQTRVLQLADVACGSGKFPAALIKHSSLSGLRNGGGKPLQVFYDLLDPSRYAIGEAASKLKPPFVERNHYCCKLQDWQPEPSSYDICWATHALYCVPAEEMDACMSILKNGIRSEGICIVVQSNRRGHYIRFYEHFLESIQGGKGTRFSTAEDVAAAAKSVGFQSQSRTLNYETVFGENELPAIEAYLQRCAFDDSVSLDQMLTGGTLGEYLASAKEQGTYRFQQSVDVLVFGNNLSSFNFWMEEE